MTDSDSNVFSLSSTGMRTGTRRTTQKVVVPVHAEIFAEYMVEAAKRYSDIHTITPQDKKTGQFLQHFSHQLESRLEGADDGVGVTGSNVIRILQASTQGFIENEERDYLSFNAVAEAIADTLIQFREDYKRTLNDAAATRWEKEEKRSPGGDSKDRLAMLFTANEDLEHVKVGARNATGLSKGEFLRFSNELDPSFDHRLRDTAILKALEAAKQEVPVETRTSEEGGKISGFRLRKRAVALATTAVAGAGLFIAANRAPPAHKPPSTPDESTHKIHNPDPEEGFRVAGAEVERGRTTDKLVRNIINARGNKKKIEELKRVAIDELKGETPTYTDTPVNRSYVETLVKNAENKANDEIQKARSRSLYEE